MPFLVAAYIFFPKETALSPNRDGLVFSLKGDEMSQQLFLIALRNVAEAQGGMGALAKKAHFGRESHYKTLSGTGNPKWHTLVSLCMAMGLNLRCRRNLNVHFCY